MADKEHVSSKELQNGTHGGAIIRYCTQPCGRSTCVRPSCLVLNLSGADLSVANLGGADLHSANLRGADLSRADLTLAKLLTQTQLDEACGAGTKPPEGLTPPKPCASRKHRAAPLLLPPQFAPNR
jgi:hypothetical protein